MSSNVVTLTLALVFMAIGDLANKGITSVNQMVLFQFLLRSIELASKSEFPSTKQTIDSLRNNNMV